MANFDLDRSMAARFGNNARHTIAAIAQNYIGRNPEVPFQFHAVSTNGIRQEDDGRYRMDMAERFPDAPVGAYCYLAGGFFLENPVRQLWMAVNCFGPVAVWLNGEKVYNSQCLEEVDRQQRARFALSLPEGENLIVIQVRKTGAGFGCIFGAEKDLTDPKRYHLPWKGKQGIMGFAWSEPLPAPLDPEKMPVSGMEEYGTGICWYPRTQWTKQELAMPQMERIFGFQEGAYAYGCTDFDTGFCRGKTEVILKGTCDSPCTFWVDGQRVWSGDGGAMETRILLAYGKHRFLAESICRQGNFGFTCQLLSGDGKPYRMENPFLVKGTDSPWVYLGLLKEPKTWETLMQFSAVHEGHYWCLDMPHMNIRPYIETSHYGRWTYPLGVTLYGMYRAGKLLGRNDLTDYAVGHIRLCARWYPYALWDAQAYGYPSVDPKLVHMKMLDDCGSCGNTMLEMHKDEPKEAFEKLAEAIAEFMEHRVERQPDGAFYRLQQGVHYQTLWADDLYMSTPFLMRYAQLTEKRTYMDDAAEQFLLFRRYLYMEDVRLMSHVYNFTYGIKNGQDWGRGNGWVMFSLTELLEKLPGYHPKRGAILEFFREMSRGVLAVQGKNGLWHQLLTDPESYEETSCTAMFVYAFCRGIRLGLYGPEEEKDYYRAAVAGWHGIESRAVDAAGNVYGVCWGSQYSFQPEYYTKKLLWALNDVHGIGIVMLAGIEFECLEQDIKGKSMLPSFTILGDSISMGYTPYLKEELREFAFVPKVEGREAYENLDIPKGTNCGDSRMLLDYLKAEAAEGRLDKKLYLVNAGLHDIKRDPENGVRQISDEEYRKNLMQIFDLLLQSGAKVLFINTTNVEESIHNARTSQFHRFHGDVMMVNQIADEVCRQYGIPVIDLYGFTLPFGTESFVDHVHYTAEIAKKQAQFIAAQIRKETGNENNS